MEILKYVPQIVLSLVAAFIVIRCFISLFSMRPAGRPKAVLINNASGKQLAISTYETSLGRAKTSDIMLASRYASRAHAVISRRKDGWFITDTASGMGTFVNGSKIAETTRIYHEDIISIGGVEYTFVAPHAQRNEDENFTHTETVNASAQAYVTNSATGYKYAIHGGNITIGRNPDNDIAIEDMTVSRHHAVIRYTDEGWQIIDTNSTAGVGVNGYKVHGMQALENGDEIMINKHSFVFNTEGERGGFFGKSR